MNRFNVGVQITLLCKLCSADITCNFDTIMCCIDVVFEITRICNNVEYAID
ncbi:unnamed protein product, partial [Trichogramma brassicae]